MSNHRILKVTDTHLTFSYLNRKNKRLEQPGQNHTFCDSFSNENSYMIL
jgi:hypothetical protein